jgi:hypothetical protein
LEEDEPEFSVVGLDASESLSNGTSFIVQHAADQFPVGPIEAGTD